MGPGGMSPKEMLERVIPIARAAAERIRAVYAGEFAVEYKAKDDPVTIADREADAIIVEGLTRAFPGIPIVSEEGDASTFDARHGSDQVWFVDPLDGTRDFVERNGEFAVMIGLADKGRAVLGVIDCPASNRCYVGAEGLGAFEFKDETWYPIHVSDLAQVEHARLVVSRQRPSPVLAERAKRLGITRIASLGSAGLKALRVANGEADIYAHLGTAGWRWDACAPEAIVVAAGGKVTTSLGAPIDYRASSLENSEGILVTNGLLHAAFLDTILQKD
jgi:3'(2'), 5'-bisphosphate nucleotidase